MIRAIPDLLLCRMQSFCELSQDRDMSSTNKHLNIELQRRPSSGLHCCTTTSHYLGGAMLDPTLRCGQHAVQGVRVWGHFRSYWLKSASHTNAQLPCRVPMQRAGGVQAVLSAASRGSHWKDNSVRQQLSFWQSCAGLSEMGHGERTGWKEESFLDTRPAREPECIMLLTCKWAVVEPG